MGVIIGILFLEETHAEKQYRHDPGLEAGRWLLRKVQQCAAPKPPRCEKSGNPFEVQSLIADDDGLPGYRSTEGSPLIATTTLAEPLEGFNLDTSTASPDETLPTRSKPAVTKAFTRQVVLNIIGYGILA